MLQHNNVHGLCKTIVWENYMPYYISTVVKPCFILAQYFDIWKGKSISVKSVKTLWPAKKFGLIGNPSGHNVKLFEAKKYLLLIWKQQFFFISLIICTLRQKKYCFGLQQHRDQQYKQQNSTVWILFVPKSQLLIAQGAEWEMTKRQRQLDKCFISFCTSVR